MSYEKQTWVSGELITSAKLNHMEDGIKTLSEADPLPAVTTTDNGKMLVVNEGAWGVGEVPSDAVVFAGEGVGSTVQGLIGNEGEGTNNAATGDYAHVEGGSVGTDLQTGEKQYYPNTASGVASHAEGESTTASGQQSHAEGFDTTASGPQSHAEGGSTTASGSCAHAEGGSTTASGPVSHAEGQSTTASGGVSHAEGGGTTASGYRSHAEGNTTIANHGSQHVFGEFNVADQSTADATLRGTYVEIVGNGTAESRSNARTLDWDGNEVLAGGLTVGAAGITIGNTTITETQLTALLALLNT